MGSQSFNPPHRFVLVLLTAAVIVPALSVLPGYWNGQLAFVLYREPKWAALSVLGWAFLAAWAWTARHVSPSNLVSAARGKGAACLGLLAGLLAWMALGRLWGRVPENHTLELRGWVLGAAAILVCVLGHRLTPGEAWRRTLRWSLVAAGAAVTAIGLVQLITPIPGLVPIDADRYGVVQTSTFGYKNPVAWAVAAQLFIVIGLASQARGRKAAALWTLVAVEVLYIGGLQSRTALVAVVAGTATFLALDRRLRWRRGATWLAAGLPLLALSLALVLSTAARERAGTLVELARPSAYLESDRGVYLRNTLAMVADRPWGVGLGDWQTEYPVYRAVGREVAFDGLHQVRRAHADHVQVLGELGWPGLAIWLGLLASVAILGIRAAREGSRSAAAATAQWAALAVAMAGDYVVEMPYARWQWCLVLALVIMEATPGGTVKPEAPRNPAMTPALGALAALSILVVTFEIVGAAMTLRGALLEAKVEIGYRAATETSDPATRATLLDKTKGFGDAMAALPFHSKTRYRADLMTAHAAHQLGDTEGACRHLKRSLGLYPYQFPGLQLAAAHSTDALRLEFERAARHVLQEAEHGFEGLYPILNCHD